MEENLENLIDVQKDFHLRNHFQIYKAMLKLILSIKRKEKGYVLCVLISIACCFSALICPKSSFRRYYKTKTNIFEYDYFDPSLCPVQFSNDEPKDCRFVFYPKNNSIFNASFNCSTGCIDHKNCFSFDSITEMHEFMINNGDSYFSFIFDDQNEKQLKIIGKSPKKFQFQLQQYSSQMKKKLLSLYGLNVVMQFRVSRFPKIFEPDYLENEIMYQILSLCCINLSVLLPCLVTVLLISQLRENKNWLLLKTSGVFESVLWLAFFSIDFVVNLILSLIFSFLFSFGSGNHIDFSLCWISYIMFSLSIQFFLYFFVPFLYKSRWTIAFVLLNIILVVVSAILWGLSDGINIGTLKILCLFFPQFASNYHFENAIFAHLNAQKLTWSNLKASRFIDSDILLLSFFESILLYFGLWILFEIMNPRLHGIPPVGWMNIFNYQLWKQLFIAPNISANYDSSLPFLDVQNISKNYFGIKTIHAVKETSFQIFQNDVILLIGPNGCGKTTLLNSITDFTHASSGNLSIFGKQCPNGFVEIQPYLGISFQENLFFEMLDVYSQLKVFGEIRGFEGNELEQEIDYLLSSLQMEDTRFSVARDLSGGQKRKLCIAMALIGSPPLIVLDEPTAGIDVTTRRCIWKALALMKNTTALISSHSIEEAEGASTKIFVMRDGNLIFNGTTNELRKKYNCGYKLQLVGDNFDIHQFQKFVQSLVKDCEIDSTRKDSIIFPEIEDMGNLLREIENNLPLFGIENFVLRIEQLENVLVRIIVEDE
jgi:ABC-type multidrug transport system ATPase subunit